MRSKNSKAHTAAESEHLAAVKSSACVVCDHPPPVEAHHIVQGDHFTTVAVCEDCHRGSFNGWHGRRSLWKIKKMDEMSALNETLRRINA